MKFFCFGKLQEKCKNANNHKERGRGSPAGVITAGNAATFGKEVNQPEKASQKNDEDQDKIEEWPGCGRFKTGNDSEIERYDFKREHVSHVGLELFSFVENFENFLKL